MDSLKNIRRKMSPEFLGKVLVLGKGVSGSAVYAYLEGQGDRVSRLDMVDESSLEASISYDLTIASPGISQFSDFYDNAKRISKEIISEIEFAWRESELESKWVSITGTNGKTTTTALTAHILTFCGKCAVAVGNIGEASISHVDGNAKIYVAECSSYQLASCKNFKPDTCAILNITPDHLKWHKNFDNYRDAKFKILSHAKHDEKCVIYLDDSLKDLIDNSMVKAKVVTPNNSKWNNKISNIAKDMCLKGEHNIENAICAAELAEHMGCQESKILTGIKNFAPLPHRIEPCGEADGVKFYNDSKATNVDATIKALSAFENSSLILLLGGRDKGSDLTPLVKACKNSNIKCVILYGESLARFAESFKTMTGISQKSCSDLKSAVACAMDFAECGDNILLSPACASFDEFSSFEERGDYFKSLVRDIVEKKMGLQ